MEAVADQPEMKTDVTLPGDGIEPAPAEKKEDASKEMAPKETTPKTTKKKSEPIKLDFSKRNGSPFQSAKKKKRRLKMFIWGDSGTGKTTRALQFPGVAVIDAEGGTNQYGDKYDFDVLSATSADEIMAALDWLSTNKHDYKTLVIDPVTVYWEALQDKWNKIYLKRNKGSKGYKFEFYDMQAKDWMTIKSEFKEFMRKLITLDMNVVVTAREKTKFKDGSFMVADGETFDGEKSLPYMFDVVIRLYKTKEGKHKAVCRKDRSGNLPTGEFDPEYEVFEAAMGKQSLTRKAKPIELATEAQKQIILDAIEKSGASQEQVESRLAHYGADDLDSLTKEAAGAIIQSMESSAKK